MIRDFEPGSPLEEAEDNLIWNRPAANDKPKPQLWERWILVAGICLCLALLIRAGVDAEKVFGPAPVTAKVSR